MVSYRGRAGDVGRSDRDLYAGGADRVGVGGAGSAHGADRFAGLRSRSAGAATGRVWGRSVQASIAVGLALALIVRAVPAEAATAGDVPEYTDDPGAVSVLCDDPITEGSYTECDEAVESIVIDASNGTATMRLIWYRTSGVNRLAFRNIGASSGTWNTGEILWCAYNDPGGWQFYYRSASGSVNANTTTAVASNSSSWEPTSGSAAAYVFTVANPDGTFPTEWAIGLESVCAAADPGAPPTGPATTPVLSTSGDLLPDVEVTILLAAPDHDGEDVTCYRQGIAGSATGTVGTPTAGEFTFTATWTDNGIYAVWCEADDGAFDDTDDGLGNEVGEVRLLVTIGSGLDEVIDDSCGSWMNIGCHIGAALRWAFVPDDDVVGTFMAEVETAFPFSLAADLLDALDVLTTWEETGITPGIVLPAYVPGINDPTATLTITAPASMTAGAGGDTCTYDPGDLGASPDCEDGWAFGGDGGVQELWGYRTTIRSIATVVLYLGFAWGLWKRFDQETTQSG